jgi:hypothetical protein
MKMNRGMWLLITCYIGLVVGTGGEGSGYAQDALVSSAPAELKAWLGEATSPPTLPPGSYPVSQLTAVLPPHAAQWLATEGSNGTTPALDVVAPRAYDIPISDHVHQLTATGELDDTSRCGRELPFPGLEPTANDAGLKAIWNLFCRNRGGSFEYLAHGMRGSGPNPHRSFTNNGRYDYGPKGFGSRSLTLAPDEQQGNESSTWTPWARNGVESFYVYTMDTRRVRPVSTTRREKFAGTHFTRERLFGWEGQYFVYDWVVLGKRSVLAVLDSRHDFPKYFPINQWVPDDQWMLRPALLIVGKQAQNLAESAYVALWLDSATFEPLWAASYDETGTATSIRVLTFKWNAQYRRHVTLGQSTVDLDANGTFVGGSIFEASFCHTLHHPDASVDDLAFSGKVLGQAKSTWSDLPPGCE